MSDEEVDEACREQDDGENDTRIDGGGGPEIGAYPLPEEEQFEVGHREYPQDAGYHFQHEDRFSALPFRLK